MRETRSPSSPPRRVGVYERLGRVSGSPAKTISIAALVLILMIVIAIIIARMG